jgi:methionyl-tRNA synthetase
MSETQKKFYLTTPIYYVNARPHIGHAYTTIAADVIARRHRLLGDDTFFLTGTDEHGQKIERSATAAGIPPQQFADQVSAQFESLWKRMGITNDDYIRTTEPRHKRGVQQLFSQLQQNGFIELRAYTGQYCISDETFVDVPVGAPCPECGRITETVTEENYFFKLSEFQLPLINLIESGELNIQPDSRKNEVLSFLRGNVNADMTIDPIQEKISDVLFGEIFSAEEGKHPTRAEAEQLAIDKGDVKRSAQGKWFVPGALKDLSISRSSFKWGIPVPGDEKHVIYVWLDALANYMTAVGYGSDDPADQEKFKKYWPADLHLVGKEIIRFHCVYWPAFLLALNPATAGKKPEEVSMEVHKEWAKDWLPKAITAHGWLLFEESKMSKSRGNIVRTETILDAFGTLCPPSSASPSSSVILSEAKNPRISLEAPPNSPEGTAAAAVPSAGATHLDEASRPVKGTASAVPQNAPPTGAALAAEVPSSSPQPAQPTKAEQDLFAADVIRYFLLREIPFGQDGSFSFDALVQRYNSDLANGYGNLVSRTLSMVEKYFGGEIPFGRMDDRVGFEIQLMTSTIWNNYDELDFSSLLHNISNIIRAADQHITSAAPWKIAADKSRTEELKNVLYTAIESIRIVTSLIEPILPYTATRVFSQLGIPVERTPGSEPKWTANKLGPLSPIFPRAPKELIQTMTDMELNQAAPKPAEPAGLPQVNIEVDNPAHNHTEFRESPISSESAIPALNPIAETVHPLTAATTIPDTPQIAIDDFVKIDLRVAKIIVAERIPKADKLLRLEVDLGYETRQILSGIAQWYTPEELIGRNIVVIANLAPRKMRGLESHGMLLAASHGEDGKPVLATFGEEIALGSRLK